MNSAAVAGAIRARARLLADTASDYPLDSELRDDAELLVVLARIVEGKDVPSAFGAPGDWGYSHPIGRALAARESPKT